MERDVRTRFLISPIDSACPPSVCCGMQRTDAERSARMPACAQGTATLRTPQPAPSWLPLGFPARFAKRSVLTQRRIS